ncbi:unnamed protein product [Closterium sp. NIES-54]
MGSHRKGIIGFHSSLRAAVHLLLLAAVAVLALLKWSCRSRDLTVSLSNLLSVSSVTVSEEIKAGFPADRGEESRRDFSESYHGEVVCWWSGAHGGHDRNDSSWSNQIHGPDDDSLLFTSDASANTARSTTTGISRSGDENRGRGGVVIFGPGCRHCVAGRLCTFEFAVRRPATWTVPPGMAFKHELAVQLVGPSLVRADVIAERGDVSKWRVAYRVWDAGLYEVVVRSGCGSLNYSASFAHAHEHDMAQWTLAVRPSSKPSTTLPAARVQQEPSFSLSEAAKREAVADGALGSACDHGASHGRWLLDVRTGKYREINFVGDSHQRFLVLHLAYLMTHRVNASHVDYHGDISISVPGLAPANDAAPQGGGESASGVRWGLRGENDRTQQREQQIQQEFGELKLNFYWVDGIYKNGQFGCE